MNMDLITSSSPLLIRRWKFASHNIRPVKRRETFFFNIKDVNLFDVYS